MDIARLLCGERGALVRGNYLVFAFALCKRLLLHAAKPPDWIIARSTDGVVCALAAKIFGMKTKIALHNHGWEERAYEVEKRLAHGPCGQGDYMAGPVVAVSAAARDPFSVQLLLKRDIGRNAMALAKVSAVSKKTEVFAQRRFPGSGGVLGETTRSKQ